MKLWETQQDLVQDCINPGRQLARVTKFCMVAPIFVGPECGTYFVLSFWCLELWGIS